MVETFLLDVDAAGDDSEEVAKAVSHCIRKLQSMTDVPLRILGHTTDSGGGGTLESLLSELQERVEDLLKEEYIVASCSLHNLQTALRNAIIDVLGEGGKLKGTNEFKKNAMQLLHGTYNLRNYLPQPFLHSSWEKSRDVIRSSGRYKEFQ